MANFLDYITNIQTLAEIQNEGSGNIAVRFECEGFGISGDGEGQVEIPPLEANGDGEQLVYGSAEFPLFEVVSQNAINGDAEFPAFQVEGSMTQAQKGNAPFPAFDVEGQGRSGNSGEFYFYIQVEGEGNANREYEPCD